MAKSKDSKESGTSEESNGAPSVLSFKSMVNGNITVKSGDYGPYMEVSKRMKDGTWQNVRLGDVDIVALELMIGEFKAFDEAHRAKRLAKIQGET